MAYTIDTAAAIRNLEEAGLEPIAAQAIVDTVSRTDSDFVTENTLNARLEVLEARLTARIIGAQVATAMLLFAALKWLG